MVDPCNKKFRLQAAEIKPLVTGFGACFASDMIAVEGRKVAFMYREDGDFDGDSGWRFMSGYELPEYMDNPDNHSIHDVNTIANYDPEIIPFLDAPAGSAFERPNGEGPFVEVFDFELDDDDEE